MIKEILVTFGLLTACCLGADLNVEAYMATTKDQGMFTKALKEVAGDPNISEDQVLALRTECRKKITFRRKNCKNVTNQMCNRLVKFGVWKEKPKRPSSVHTYKFKYINADRIEYYDYRDGKSAYSLVLKEIKNCEARLYEEEKKCIDALFEVYDYLLQLNCDIDSDAQSFTMQESKFVGDNWECEEWITEQVNKTAVIIKEKLAKKTRGTCGEGSRLFY